MKDLLLYIVKSIVENTDAVEVSENETDTSVVYKITVDSEDIG